jgi:hypothetical protein
MNEVKGSEPPSSAAPPVVEAFLLLAVLIGAVLLAFVSQLVAIVCGWLFGLGGFAFSSSELKLLWFAVALLSMVCLLIYVLLI